MQSVSNKSGTERTSDLYHTFVTKILNKKEELQLRSTSISRRLFDICSLCGRIIASETHSVQTQIAQEQI